MDDLERTKMLVEISKMYYEHDLSQKEISKKYELSRTYIGKLLNEAREKGIVEIRVNDPLKSESTLEGELRRKFGLRKTIIVPTRNDDPALLDKLASSAADHLNTILNDGEVIGVSWGQTIYALSNKIIPRSNLTNIRVVQVSGGVSKIQKNVYASDIPKNIAEALGGTYDLIPSPAIMETVSSKTAVMKDKNIVNVLSEAKKSDIAIFTAGAFSRDNVFVKGGYFSENDIDTLGRVGAIGDICSHVINENGDICDHQIEKRTIAITLDDLLHIPNKICIAAGCQKARSILAAMKIGCIDVLVTNEDTAKQLMA